MLHQCKATMRCKEKELVRRILNVQNGKQEEGVTAAKISSWLVSCLWTCSSTDCCWDLCYKGPSQFQWLMVISINRWKCFSLLLGEANCKLLWLFFYCVTHRFGPVLHKDVGGGQPRPSGGGANPAVSAHRWELGPQWQQEDVALREQPLSHHHHQIRPVPGLVLPGVPSGQ